MLTFCLLLHATVQRLNLPMHIAQSIPSLTAAQENIHSIEQTINQLQTAANHLHSTPPILSLYDEPLHNTLKTGLNHSIKTAVDRYRYLLMDQIEKRLRYPENHSVRTLLDLYLMLSGHQTVNADRLYEWFQ